MSSSADASASFGEPVPLVHTENPVLLERQKSLGERANRVASPMVGTHALSLKDPQQASCGSPTCCGSPTAPYVRLNLMDSKQTLASLIGNIRDPQRVRSHRGQVGWWPPPDIVRRLSRCALGYVFSVILSLLLINWVLHWLPSTEQLAAQAGKDPGSMLLRIPRSFDDMRAVHSTLEAYKGLHFSQLMVLYGLVFLFMQVFIIPGCFFVTVLLGSLIPVVPAVTLVTVLTTIGCVINYEVAQYLLADVLLWMFPRKVRQFQDAVAEHQSNLFNYLLFLRSVPILPSWLINVGSPLANVPLRTFVAATMLGFQPTYIILVSAGRALATLHSWKDIYQWQAIVGIAVCGAMSLLPIFLKRMVGADFGRLPDSTLPR